MLKILQTCKGNAFWFLFAFQSRLACFCQVCKAETALLFYFLFFFKIPFFFGDPSLRRGFEVMFRLWTPSPRGNHNKRRVHRFTSRGVNGSGVVPSAALMSAGVNTCWELVPDRHLNVTFKESIREREEKCDFLSLEAANLWPSVVITTPNVSLRLLHPMSVFLLF